MSQTTINLGFVPKNREIADWDNLPAGTKFYKDNIVQFKGSSYICSPVDYDPEHHTDSFVTVEPWTESPQVLNAGWKVFASGNNKFTTGESVDGLGIDQSPQYASSGLITSKAVAAHGSAFDISEYNKNGNTLATYATLTDALAAVPAAAKKGGMSIKFIHTTPAKYTVVKTEGATEQPTGTEIQSDPGIISGTYTAGELSVFSTLPATLNSSLTYYLEVTETVDEQEVTTYTSWVITYVQSSDNKYVQYRLMTTSFSTNATQWQGVDDNPTAGSSNLVESGGVEKTKVTKKLGINLADPNDPDIEYGESYNTSGYIEVEVGETYCSAFEVSLRKVFYYNENKQLVQTDTSSQTSFTVPNGVKYVRLYISLTAWPRLQLTKNIRTHYTPYSEVGGWNALPAPKSVDGNTIVDDSIETRHLKDESVTDDKLKSNRLEECEESIYTLDGLEVIESKNLYDKRNVIKGQYISVVGSIVRSDAWATTNYIPVVAGESYYITAKTSARDTGLIWVNSNKELISYKGGIYNKVQVAPENAAYLMFNVGQNNIFSTDVMVAKSVVPVDYEPPQQIEKSALKDFDSNVESIINDKIFTSNLLKVSKDGDNLEVSIDTNNKIVVTTSRLNNYYQDNGVFNFVSCKYNNVTWTPTDDVAPLHILNTTIGANHGQPCYNATINAHGLTNIAVGTYLTNEDSIKFYIMRIVDANNIILLSENQGTESSPSFATLTTGTLSDGTNSFSVTSVSSEQLKPAIKNHQISIYNHGKNGFMSEVVNDGQFTCDYLDVVEKYDVMNPVSILNNIISRAGSNEDPVYDGTVDVTIEIIYRILSNLTVLVIENVIAQRDVAFTNIMFAQSVKLSSKSTLKYYVPNSLPCNGRDLRKPVYVNWDGAGFFTTSNYTQDKTKPINRILQIDSSVGYALGFLIDCGVGKNLFSFTSGTFEIRGNSGKIYPHGVNGNVIGDVLYAGQVYSAVMYRALFVPDNNVSGRISFYNFEYEGSVYVFLDYSASILDRVVLNNPSLNGCKIDVLENRNTTFRSDVYNDGFYVKSTYVEGETSYIILRINKGI